MALWPAPVITPVGLWENGLYGAYVIRPRGLGAVAVYLPTLLAIPIASWYLGSRAAAADSAGPIWHPRRLLDHAVGAAHRRGPRLLVRATQLSVLAWARPATDSRSNGAASSPGQAS